MPAHPSSPHQASPNQGAPVLVEVWRGSAVESRHRGAIVAATATGQIVAAVGDPNWLCFLRSAAKPFQAMAVLRTGAAERFALTTRELAIMAASHNGEPEHTAVVAGLLSRLGLTADALRCGTHPPFNRAAARRLAGVTITALHNNCSGKHAGMLAGCLAAGFATADYDAPTHPLQTEIANTIATMCNVAVGAMPRGLDGCTVPTWAVPLQNLAVGYARLFAHSPYPEESRRVATAMLAHPELIGGTERIDTDLMRAVPGHLLSKVGAEGVHAVAVPASDRFPDALGLAVKIEDGDSFRARNTVVLEVLRHLELLGAQPYAALMAKYSQPILTHRQQPAGELRAVFQLTQATP
ncbi:asparaginase [Chloracidobacterium aggregatum]|uniref:Asparaginase n=1 Tax=Chloracidobacterium sp. N TaxID=2821540 RepID=A0ABX8AX37_9BACT|nr:asparaginase [Chloracidobacterium aggregatum]QUV84393.1 asparaginase [Chloracidobacterium sp. 2]QUV87124.1 asparaginase [Chloracidobacterium sp. S]QUV90025.1 asparaginase [Chloracidobacterium sp. A]QUV93234.1 asparaginase [Chloracidobacterium sp. N]QUV96390.1 asparaginase [Chloracidobacterium sp. E]